MRQFVTTATIIMSLPDGMTDQEGFYMLNQQLNPLGIDFVFPLTPMDRPAIIIRILRSEEKK